MIVLAAIASLILIVLAALHLLWALGHWWPIRDETHLARAVVGTKGITKMPGAVACSLVVVALLFAAAMPWFVDTPLRALALFVIAVVFQVRAIATYSPLMKRLTPEQPFRRLDEAYYAPLCIALGMIFMILAGQAMT